MLIQYDKSNYWQCTICGEYWEIDGQARAKFRYCPNCGEKFTDEIRAGDLVKIADTSGLEIEKNTFGLVVKRSGDWTALALFKEETDGLETWRLEKVSINDIMEAKR